MGEDGGDAGEQVDGDSDSAEDGDKQASRSRDPHAQARFQSAAVRVLPSVG